jgi:hypothetical protein
MFRKNFNTAKIFRRHDSLQTLKVIYIFFLKKKLSNERKTKHLSSPKHKTRETQNSIKQESLSEPLSSSKPFHLKIFFCKPS